MCYTQPLILKPNATPGLFTTEDVEIADVAVTKYGQRLDEILIYFYPHFIEELSKVVFKKTVSYNTPLKIDAIMFAQHYTLVINMQEMRTAYACYKCARNARVSYSIHLL